MARHNQNLGHGGRHNDRDDEERTSALEIRLALFGVERPSVGSRSLSAVAWETLRTAGGGPRALRAGEAPIERRIRAFLDELAQAAGAPKLELPEPVLSLDQPGFARELSLPLGEDRYENSEVTSYRLEHGVLHNPANDRRTTKGVFHVAEHGPLVPQDKIAVPLGTYLGLLRAAFEPNQALGTLPYASASRSAKPHFVSLLIRPIVSPRVPGVSVERRSEVLFFAPAGLVSNLDFVESIFGNAGDPLSPERDAALDPTWTGHTGAVILAPQLRSLKKIDLGLPPADRATPRQLADGSYYTDPEELYNGGKPFKITARDSRGRMVTILADNYFGYSKKEIKTQISLSANLLGGAEEEHSGGALAFATHTLGEQFQASACAGDARPSPEVLLGDRVRLEEDGVLTDVEFENIHVLPETFTVDAITQEIRFRSKGRDVKRRALPGHHYLHPSGYKLRLERRPGAARAHWLLTFAEPTFCHKPCTVSGGGKSEISKSLGDMLRFGPLLIGDFRADLDRAEAVIERDYSDVIRPERRARVLRDPGRSILSPERSLGSVIKLLTENAELYTERHNQFIRGLTETVRAIVFAIKRSYRPEWGKEWRAHFSVNWLDGAPGHELIEDERPIICAYLRVGRNLEGSPRMFKLRQDFATVDKVQQEDDITASVVAPVLPAWKLPIEWRAHASVKLVANCEERLFQRPDDAIVPGADAQTERDMSGPDLFVSNFEPLSKAQVKELVSDMGRFDFFTPPMQEYLRRGAEREGFSISSDAPRLVNGAPSKNPRYLQLRPDLADPSGMRLAELGARLSRGLGSEEAVVFPVSSVLSGRRNNPPDQLDGKKIPPLCVYGPLHYQELPELFMDYVCSVTGKSPSTTGAGSEGALTKGPFNALPASFDLNAALLSFVLTGYGGFSTAAGWIGPGLRVDHDISLLVPELWARLTPEERDPAGLIARGELEPVRDFEYHGRPVLGSRLGYRITERFVHAYLGRIFDSPRAVFTEAILRPETQSESVFVDGIDTIVEAQRKSALAYFEDGSIEFACPPLRVLLTIMAHGSHEGRDVRHPAVRELFTRESVLSSAWYAARLEKKVEIEREFRAEQRRALADASAGEGRAGLDPIELARRRAIVEQELRRVSGPEAARELVGTLGVDPALFVRR